MSKQVRRSLNWLREAVSRFRGGGTLLPAWRLAVGEVPEVSFSDCLTAYQRDPSCKAFVDFLADQTVGMGFYTTVREEYEQAEEAKAVVDSFNESVNLDGLLQIGAREVVGLGNSFWLKTNEAQPFGLKILPVTGFEGRKAIERDETGAVKAYNYSFENVKKTFAPEQVIHFNWNPVNFSPFGTGVLQVLLQEISFNGSKRVSCLEMKWRIENILPDVFEKYAGPDELWIFPGVSPDKLSAYQSLIKGKPKAGARFIYDKADADIKTVQVDPRVRYAEFIEYVLNQVYLGGQTPLPKLFTTPGFTEACYSEDTLTLTENGWKHYWKIGEEEKIATYNPETGTVEFHKPEACYVYDYEGDMINFKSSHVDALVTPNHTMFYATRHWRTCPASELLTLKHFQFKTNGDWEALPAKTEFVLEGVTGNGLRANQALNLVVKAEPWLQLIGYYISEGAMRSTWASITQKNPAIMEKIRGCLNSLRIPYHEYYDKRFNAVEFQLKGGKRLLKALRECGANIQEKYIPRKYKELSPEQLKVLLNALIEGDGSRDKRLGRKFIEYFTISETLAYDVMEIALRMGHSAFIYKRVDKRPNRRPTYIVSIHPHKSETRVINKTRVWYKGKIYCFTVKNHLFFTARNGKPTIQGNSAKAAIEIAERKVMALQRFIKRIVEREIFVPVLEQAGFDPKQARCRLNWGMPQALDYEKLAALLPQLVVLTRDVGAIKPSEMRKILRDVCKLPLEEIERPAA